MRGSNHSPDKWVVVKQDNKHYRVLASWRGSYLTGDSWQINSGIKSVTEDTDYWYFHGYSGSVYKCRKDSYGLIPYTETLLAGWNSNNTFILLDSDFNFQTLNNI